MASVAIPIVAGALQFWPLIENTIEDVEALKGSGNGAAKKAAVLDIATNTLTGIGAVTGENTSALQAALGPAIDAIVGIKNFFQSWRKPKLPIGGPVPAEPSPILTANTATQSAS